MDQILKQQAIMLTSPEIEIYFQLADVFSVEENHRTSLLLPQIDRASKDEVSTNEVSDHLCELVRYYRDVISTAEYHHQEYSEYSDMFWLRLRISEKGKAVFTFSYWDEMPRILEFRDWMHDNVSLSVFGDGDQGWEFVAQIQGDNVYLYEEDGFHDGHLVSNYYISRIDILQELSLVCDRTLDIARNLSANLGQDLWSRWRGYPGDRINFGTSNWNPKIRP